MAEAVFVGSFGSSGGGLRAVFTEQNLHPLVHVSPINCKENCVDKKPQTERIVQKSCFVLSSLNLTWNAMNLSGSILVKEITCVHVK